MADHNPWAAEDSERSTNTRPQQYSYEQSHQSPDPPLQQYYDEPPAQSYQQRQQTQQPSHQPSQQQYQQPLYDEGPGSTQYSPPPGQPDYNAWSDAPTGNPPLPPRHPAHGASPMSGIRRSDTDDLVTDQSDRAEQMEHLQAYEATANESQDDKNRAQLEKEFPDIDGSLIAAIYGDTKDLSETREMLQELGRQ